MNTNFWLLAPPQNQKRATLAEDTKLEQIICAADVNHRRGGRRLGDVRATRDPNGIKRFHLDMATGYSRLGASVGRIPAAPCYRVRNTASGRLAFQAIRGESTRTVRAHHHRMGRHGIECGRLEGGGYMRGLQL